MRQQREKNSFFCWFINEQKAIFSFTDGSNNNNTRILRLRILKSSMFIASYTPAIRTCRRIMKTTERRRRRKQKQQQSTCRPIEALFALAQYRRFIL